MSERDRLLREFETRLERAAQVLADDERTELLADMREHVEAALAEAGNDDDATVRSILEALGSPDEIVAAALETDAGPGAEVRAERSRGASLRPLTAEERAMLALTVGSIALPFVGPLVGLWLAAASASWSLAQKRTAAAIVFVLLALPATIVLPGVAAGELNWAIGSAGFLLPFVPLSGLLAATYLVVSSSFVVRVSRRG